MGSDAGGVGFPAHILGVGELVVFFVLHASVLEPDFDLALREAEGVGNLNAAPARQIAVEVELLLQF